MGLEDATEKAWADMESLDIEEATTRCGVPPPDTKGRLWVPLVGENYAVLPGERRVLLGGESDARPDKALIVLHYLLGADAAGVAGRLISFRELRGGAVYYQAFEGRTIKRLIAEFGDDPKPLEHAARSLGGRRAPMGDVGFTIDALPKVPVTVAVWKGDDEIPPSANMVFDETVALHLETEDVAVLGGQLTGELVRRARPG